MMRGDDRGGGYDDDDDMNLDYPHSAQLHVRVYTKTRKSKLFLRGQDGIVYYT